MFGLILTVVLSGQLCPDTAVMCHKPDGYVDHCLSRDLTEADRTSLLRASTRCGELYPRSPCLKEFHKLGEGRYYALCSADGGKQ